jgi:hypothetical protein
MKRNWGRWFAAAPIVATGLASLVLGFLAMNGVASPASGDLAISGTTLNGMTMGVLLAALVVIGLALAHVTSRRLRFARLRRAPKLGLA